MPGSMVAAFWFGPDVSSRAKTARSSLSACSFSPRRVTSFEAGRLGGGRRYMAGRQCVASELFASGTRSLCFSCV